MRRMGWSSAPRYRNCRRPDERGAALVEFALIMPVLASLMLGTVTGGAAYYSKITMTDAVREGSRFGATLTDSSSFATNVRDRTVQQSTGELGNTNICVQLVRAGSPETVVRSYYPGGGSSCPFANAPASPTISPGYCVVKVWSQRPSQLQAFFFTRTINLQARSVAAYERGATAGVC